MRQILALCAATLLPACAAFSPDGGLSVVGDVVGKNLRNDVAALRTPDDAVAARERMRSLLHKRLTVDNAARIALLNNRGLQAAYNELGLAEAAMVQASLPPNPTLSVQRLAGPAEIEIERRIAADILALATLPARSDIAAGRFLQAQFTAAEQTLRLAADTRRAYYRAVAAREQVSLLQQAVSAAETASKLARRLGETGALNKLDQAREHVFHAEIVAQLATARQRAASEREPLVRLMGLWGADLAFNLPNALPPLPRRVQALPSIEVEAVRCRVDLQIARLELGLLAKSQGLTRATRFINLLEVSGLARTTTERATGERIRDRGFDVEFQVPIFDGGEVRVRQAEESYLQAVNRLTEKAVNLRSEARDAYRTYRSTYDIAMHYRREVLPLRQIISDEMLLRYNAMQIDVFALLIEARQRLNASVAALEAQRDFWLASVDLMTAVTGGGVAGSGESMRATQAIPGGTDAVH